MAKPTHILNEIKWEGIDIEIGKIYTNRDMPAFKTPEQIKKDNELNVDGRKSPIHTSDSV